MRLPLPLAFFRTAPLAFGATGFGAGLLLAGQSGLHPLTLGASALLSSLACWLAIKARRETLAWLLAAVALAGFAGGYSSFRRTAQESSRLAGLSYPVREALVEGLVTEIPALPAESRVTLFNLSLRRLTLPGRETEDIRGCLRVSLNWRDSEVSYGDIVRLSGTLRVPDPPTNPGQKDGRRVFRTRRINAGLSCWDRDSLNILARGRGDLFRSTLEKIRTWAAGQVVRHLRGAEGQLLASMLFGSKGDLSSDLLDSFRATGLMHVLVTSGLHVGLLAWMSLGLFALFNVSPRRASLYTLPVLVGYLILCGVKPPLLRSTLMFSLLVVGRGLGRAGSPVNSLGAAALIILIADPERIWDPSFGFSFAATFGILTLVPWLVVRRGAIPLPIAQLGSCTLAAQLALLPLLAKTFNTAPFLGTFANLLVIPAMGVFLGVGFILLIAGWLPGVGFVFGQIGSWLLSGVMHLVTQFASLPLSSITVPPFSPPFLAGYCAWLLGFLAWQKSKSLSHEYSAGYPKFICLGGLASLCILVWRAALAPPPGNLAATFLNVGHGLAAVIRLPTGRILLFDGGNSYSGESVVAPYLKTNGVGRLAAVIMSHPHADHLAGLIPVLRQLPADMIFLSREGFGRGVESRRLRNLLLKRRILCRDVRAGDEIAGEPGVSIRFINPPADSAAESRRRTRKSDGHPIVLAISYKGSSLLLTGDITVRTEREILSGIRRLGPDNLLQVPHHGSIEGSSRGFLAALNPKHAVVSAGRFRRSPHPHPATLIRLREQGAQIWITAQSGAISAVADDLGWRVAPAIP